MNADFEKYARHQLSSHEETVDGALLWQRIEPHVRPEKKRRRFFWLLLTGFLVFSTSLFAWFVVQEDKQLDLGNSAAAIDESSLANLEKEVKGEEALLIKDKVSPKETTILNSEEEIVQTANETSKKPLNTTTTILAERQYRELKQASTATQSIPPLLAADHDEHSLKLNGKRKDEVGFVETKAMKTHSIDLLQDLPLRAVDFIPYEWKIDLPKTKRTDLLQEAEDARTSFVSRLKMAVGIYGGIGRQSSSLEEKDNANKDYIILRNNSEEQLEVLQVGLSLLLQSKSKVSFRTGVEYNQLASRFKVDFSKTTFDTIPNGIVQIIINKMTMDTIYEEGQVINSITTTYDKETYNYLRQIDVPLLIGYSFDYQSWSFGLEAGVIANLRLKTKGEIFKADESFYDLKEDAEQWYKKSIGIAPLLNLNINYQLRENMQVHLSPFVRFKSRYDTAENPLKESYANIGLSAGFRYFFKY